MPLKNEHTILVVDDETSIIKALKRLFRQEKHKILTASDGTEGLVVLNNSSDPVSLIISDQRMPGMSGSAFLEMAREIVPDAIRFILTGYSDMNAIVDSINKGRIHRYLSKPWNDDDLVLQVRQSLEQYELVMENKRLQELTLQQNKELQKLNAELEKKVQDRTREIIAKSKKVYEINKELESGLFDTVRAFVAILELQAPLLASHGRRVSQLSQEICRLLKVPDKEVNPIEIAALLHDIGKMSLPDKETGNKSTEQTEEETAAYQNHPLDGQNIIGFISGLSDVSLMIRSHHERYDGQGYPDNLKEDAIPLGARIIAVADAYDKIINLRVNSGEYINAYLKSAKNGHDISQLSKHDLLEKAAVHHLKQFGFTWYDPDIVKAFLGYIKDKKSTGYAQLVVGVNELISGMTLLRSLYSDNGRFLLPSNTVLTRRHVDRLKIIHNNNSITRKIHVLVNRK